MDETQTVDTEIELDVPADDAWPAVATPAGLAAWLAPEVELDAVVPGAPGRIVDDEGVARRLSIQHVDVGRSVTFTWWREDDPGEASTVTLVVDPAGDDRSRVRVVEVLVASAQSSAQASVSGSARSARSAVAQTVWLGRLARLGAATPRVRV